MPKVNTIRELIAQYFTMVRELVRAIFTIASGVEGTTPEEWEPLLRQTGDVGSEEAKWARHVITIVKLIGRYLRLIHQWIIHLRNLCNNLKLSEQSREAIVSQSADPMTFLEKNELDIEYLHWIITNTTTELANLIGQTEELAEEFPKFKKSVGILKSKHLLVADLIIKSWSEEQRESIWEDFHHNLASAYRAADTHKVKQHLAKYITHFARLVSTMPFFLGYEDGVKEFHSRKFEQRLRLFDKFEKLIKDLEKILEIRSIAYTLFIQHEEALVAAMLPEGEDVIAWRSEFLAHPERPATDYIPDKFDRGRLLVAVMQGLTNIRHTNDHVTEALSLFNKMQDLISYLNSEELNQFFTADAKRAGLFFKYREQLIATLEELQKKLGAQKEDFVS